jgi:hypothetical protein
MSVWLTAVVVVVSRIRTPKLPPMLWQDLEYTSKYGYSWSLVLLYLPLAFLGIWYVLYRDKLQLRSVMKANAWIVFLTALLWIALDVFFANLLFRFPDQNAHFRFTTIPGYLWRDDCATISTLLRLSCYRRSIPLEEVLFYLGGAALIAMMYMWASEDFYGAYTLRRHVYTIRAKQSGPLVDWNAKIILIGLGILGAGILIKKLAPWHDNHDGLPDYLFAELLIVFVPLSALYNRVQMFTNSRAFIFVVVLEILVSLVWEATLAVPYGWWNYQRSAMIGITVRAWSSLPIEACGLWVSVGWGATFVYEATKIKAVTGKTWRQVLFGATVADRAIDPMVT